MLTPRHRALFEASYSTLLLRRTLGAPDGGPSSERVEVDVCDRKSLSDNDLTPSVKPGDDPGRRSG